MDKKTTSTIFMTVGLLLVLAGYFNIRPVGPYVRKLFFDAKYHATRVAAPPAPAQGGNASLAAACRNNLTRIESAKAKLRSTRAIGNMSWGEVYRELGVNSLACPAGGEYILGSQQVSVRCSISNNGTSSTADDHIAY